MRCLVKILLFCFAILYHKLLYLSFDNRFAAIRGLLQKRTYLQSRGEKLGRSFLIFGSRCSSEALFHDEIEDFQKQGVLTKVFMCYSREIGEAKEYTTDKLRSKRISIILGPILMQPNTHVFVCGSANMAEDCKNALRDVTSQDTLDAINKEGRLHCDVFGTLSSPKKQTKRNISYTVGAILDEELVDSFDIDHVAWPSKNGRGDGSSDLSSSCIMLGSRGTGLLGRSAGTEVGASGLGMDLMDLMNEE